MKVLGITGPTGAGKTTVLNWLADRGAAVLDCDRVYDALVEKSPLLRQELEETFADIFLPDGQLNRAKLGKLVFADPVQLRKLNAIVYYHLGLEIRRILVEEKQKGTALAVIDAVNLTDSGLGELCTLTVAVLAPAEVRARRIVTRDGLTMEQAMTRICAQKDDAYYEKHCHRVLHNRGTEAELIEQAQALLSNFM